MKKALKRKFICIECGKKSRVSERAMNVRKYKTGENICIKCYKKKHSCGRYGAEYYPKEMQNIWRDKVWDYDVVFPYLSNLNSKKKLRFKCQECNKIDEMGINAMKNRKICGIKKICKRCSLKFATNSEEWIESNSKAQFI